MGITACKVDAMTQSELLHRLSEATGFTLKNCKIAYDALVEIMSDTIEEGRAIVFMNFGRIEPFVKHQRKMYKLVKGEGVELDENGQPVTYIVPETNNVKFHMANSYKYRLNPGIFSGEEVYMGDVD